MPTVTGLLVAAIVLWPSLARSNMPSQVIIESPHNYANLTDQTWTATPTPGAAHVSFQFGNLTEVENGFDYLYIYDASNNLVGSSPYTGTTLASMSFTIAGDTVKVRLVSDNIVTKYGFKAYVWTPPIYPIDDSATRYITPTSEGFFDNGPHRSSAGSLYAFTGKQTGTRARVYKSSDSGVTWSAAGGDTFNDAGGSLGNYPNNGSNPANYVPVTRGVGSDSDKLWLPYLYNDGSSSIQLRIRAFDMASDSYLARGADGPVVATYPVTTLLDIRACTASDGRVVVVWQNNGNTQLRTATYDPAADSWSTDQRIDDSALVGNAPRLGDMFAGSSGRAHLLWTFTSGNSNIYHVSVDSSNAISGTTAAFDVTVTSNPNKGLGKGLYKASSGEIVFPATQNDGKLYIVRGSAETSPSWTSSVINAFGTNPVGFYLNNNFCMVANGDCEYAVWINNPFGASNNNKLLMNTRSGGSWGTDTLLYDTATQFSASPGAPTGITTFVAMLETASRIGVLLNVPDNLGDDGYYFPVTISPCARKNYSYFGRPAPAAIQGNNFSILN